MGATDCPTSPLVFVNLLTLFVNQMLSVLLSKPKMQDFDVCD